MATSSEIQAKVDKFSINMDRLNNITNGDEQTEVTVDVGTVPSIKRLFANITGMRLRVYLTKADLDADLSEPDGVMAVVTQDALNENNTFYKKSGAADAGQWDLFDNGRRLEWRGNWDNSTEYNVYDIVEYLGSSYICLQTHTGQTPAQSTPYWSLLALGGSVADNTITTVKLVDGAVTDAKIADGSIVTAKYSNLSVTSEKIANDAITGTQLQNFNISTASSSDRDVYDKLGEVADVRDWGVDLTGASDATASFQAALDESAGYALNMPSGTIRVTSPLNLSENVHLIGVGRNSILHFDHPGFGFVKGAGAGDRSLRRLGILRSQPAPAASWIPNTYDYDFNFEGSGDFVLEDLHLYSSNRGIRFAGDSALTQNAASAFINRITGQVFITGLNITHSFNSCNIDNVKFSDYFSNDVNVVSYTRSNLEGIVLGASQSVKVGKFSVWGANKAFRIYNQGAVGSLPTGTAKNVSFEVIEAGNSESSLYVDASVDGATCKVTKLKADADISNGGVSSSPFVNVLGSNCDINIFDIYGEQTNSSLVDLGGTGNKLRVFASKSAFIDADADNTPEFNATADNEITLGTLPVTSAATQYSASGIVLPGSGGGGGAGVGGGIPAVRQYTSSTTWTKPAGLSYVKVTVVAAGGSPTSSARGPSSSFGSYVSATGSIGAGSSSSVIGSGVGGDINLVSVMGGVFGGGPGGAIFGRYGQGGQNSSGSVSGGSGGMAIKWIAAADLASSVSVTVGTGSLYTYNNNGPGIVIVEEYY